MGVEDLAVDIAARHDIADGHRGSYGVRGGSRHAHSASQHENCCDHCSTHGLSPFFFAGSDTDF